MPIPEQYRKQLEQQRQMAEMRSQLSKQYDKEMASKYTRDMPTFAEWMAKRQQPQGMADGGSFNLPDMEFRDNPESMSLYQQAMRQTTPNPGETASNFGTGIRTRVAGGDLTAGLDMNRMTQGERDQMMKALAVNYNANLGDVNVNARVQKPLNVDDVYVGMLNGSIPIGTGRAMLGMQGTKTPHGSEVNGINAGWSGKVGSGNLSANVNMPKRGGRSAQIQYQIPLYVL
jgi:uncharacterized membrane-anchored protein YhcB (DUF1043 family)